MTDLGGRTIKEKELRPLVCWDCGFEFHWWHGYLLL
jgi:predicted Zn-ribbon and HTH transcriptional regulator